MPPKRESTRETMNEVLITDQYENLSNIKVKKRCNYNFLICTGICMVISSLGVSAGYLYYKKLHTTDDGSMVEDIF